MSTAPENIPRRTVTLEFTDDQATRLQRALAADVGNAAIVKVFASAYGQAERVRRRAEIRDRVLRVVLDEILGDEGDNGEHAEEVTDSLLERGGKLGPLLAEYARKNGQLGGGTDGA